MRASQQASLLAMLFAACSSSQSGSSAANDDGGSFLCGSTVTCDGRSQVCEHVQGGVAPGVDFYACIPIPSVCDNTASCLCVTTAL
jgi:hypothetical protein